MKWPSLVGRADAGGSFLTYFRPNAAWALGTFAAALTRHLTDDGVKAANGHAWSVASGALPSLTPFLWGMFAATTVFWLLPRSEEVLRIAAITARRRIVDLHFDRSSLFERTDGVASVRMLVVKSYSRFRQPDLVVEVTDVRRLAAGRWQRVSGMSVFPLRELDRLGDLPDNAAVMFLRDRDANGDAADRCIWFATPQNWSPSADPAILQGPGSFLIDIRVAAGGLQHRYRVRLDWSGSWDGFDLSPFENVGLDRFVVGPVGTWYTGLIQRLLL